jgi:8-oxo-dGTP pyrophosphatase MutT (NUDIX family)
MSDERAATSSLADERLSRLRDRLAKPLPGRSAQARFEPDLAFGRHAGPAPASARSAAVVLLLYQHAGEWSVPLTVRPEHLTHHAGQVSLPGGLVEPGETTAAAALRELEEELGIAESEVTLLGTLSPLYLYISDFLITPHVAAAANRPTFHPSDFEVAEILEMPLSMLTGTTPPARVLRGFKQLRFYAPAQHLAGHEVWGATAMILSELAAVFADAP